MKTILKIAGAELAQLFYSPIAWFLLVAFLFQCGLAFISPMEGILTMQQIGGLGLNNLTFLTSKIFSPPYGIWPEMVRNLYLYLPLLTMGLMSREINSGTIRLLYSSPITVKEIISGKFLAMMIYNLVLVSILALIAVLGLINIHAADAGLLFAGLFGIYLLLCTYAAIGLFMSCITSYQVVAALSTLVLLGVLSYIGSLWQDIDFVRDLSWFLSITGRAEHMLMGLITTKDIVYFLVIICMFLGFSIYKLQSDRESKSAPVKTARYVLIVVAALTVGYISSLPGFIGYFDATATKSLTLTANAQKIIQETGDEPIEVTSYINLLDNRFGYGRPDQRNEDLARWEPYLRFKPGIKFNYVYFYDSTADENLFKFNPGTTLKGVAEKYAKSMKQDLDKFKTPAEIRQVIDLRPEQNRYVMQLKYKDRTTFLRLFNDQVVFPAEPETAAALKRLMQVKLPKIAFVQGELERSIDKIGDKHYKTLTNDITFRYSLVNQGFDVTTVSLNDQEIPGDITALIIADPRVGFSTVALAKIQQYIAAGGNLLIAGEPGKQVALDPILQPLGVRMVDGMLVQPDKDFSPDLVLPSLTPAAAAFTQKLQQDALDSLRVSMRGTAALSYNTDGPFTVTPLLMTDGRRSWNKRVKPNEEEMDFPANIGSLTSNGVTIAINAVSTNSGSDKTRKDSIGKRLAYAPEQGDQKGPLPAMLALTRSINGKKQRIIVSGDADFLSNSELNRYVPVNCNFDFSTAVFSWFSYGEFPIESFRPPSADKSLSITDRGISFLKILLLGVLPGLLLVMGSILLIRRKRK